MTEPICMKLGMHIIAPQIISRAYFINSYHQSVCVNVYAFIVAGQRLGKNVTAATNTRRTVKELLEALFSVRSVLVLFSKLLVFSPKFRYFSNYDSKFGPHYSLRCGVMPTGSTLSLPQS
jgi:hypothetical protein